MNKRDRVIGRRLRRVIGRAAAIITTAAAVMIFVSCARRTAPEKQSTEITVPKIWDSTALATWATPLAGLGLPPGFASEEAYYAAPVDNLRTYPVYLPGREPPGYRDRLKKQGPERLIEPEKLRTKSDWIHAGRRVFEELDTEITRTDDPRVLAYLTDAAALDSHHEPVDGDGVLLEYRWIVDRDGALKATLPSCVSCHSRLMPDGTMLRGAPSNFDAPSSPASAVTLGKLLRSPKLSEGQQLYAEFGVPWLPDDPHARFKSMTDEEVKRFRSQDTGAPVGTTVARFNGSPLFTTRMADLNGVKDRRYLDATGTHVNRGPADVARYCVLVEFAEQGVFGPYKMLPPGHMQIRTRLPDEAVYAMALYIYSLTPPSSPFPFDDLARRGKQVFEAEGCFECHTPPAYTNNKLVPVPGFDPPMNDPLTRRLDISISRVGTDPRLALQTRKGTGYYKVPSLRGLWYRGLYEHNGSVNSLEDWFDPKRCRDDYVPTGARGPGVTTRAVPGHKFGHDLSPEDKKALIAFLKTL